MSSGTLRKWIRQAEVDKGRAPGVTSAESQEIRELRRKNRELEQTIEILKAAASFRARARPATALICRFIDEEKEVSGVAPICRALVVHGLEIAARRAAAPGNGSCGIPR